MQSPHRNELVNKKKKIPYGRMKSIFFTPSKDSGITSSPSISPSPTLRSSRPSTPLQTESMMEEYVKQAESIITKWDPNTSSFAKVTSLFHESRHRESKDFLKSVKDLQHSMHYFVSHNPSSDKLVRAQYLMQIAMKRLEKEFYQILSSNRDHLDPESVSTRSTSSEDEIRVAGESISEVEQFSKLATSDLKSIAECMISSGYGKECVKIYNINRKSIIDEALYKLRIERLSSSKIQKMDWEILDLKIKTWLNSVKIAVKSLFYGERIVCDHVFSNSDSIKQSCFSEITTKGAINLFRFPESVAAKIHKPKSPEKIFRILELYQLISELYPDIESIFSFESTSVIRSQALNSLIILADTVRSILSDFESLIHKDTSKSLIPDGDLHPLTRYVMNYLSSLTDYSRILSDITADLPISNPNDNTLTIRLAWIILVLLCKIDGKAERYKDPALAYLFLANNLEYVMKKVQNSNLRYLLGEDWISKHETKVKQYAASYERIGWSRVVSEIPEDLNSTTRMSVEEAVDCFKRFNLEFERSCRKQSSWVVTGSKLREEIKVSIANNIVPAYRAFYDKYHRVLLRTENDLLESIVRFTPDDLGNYLSDLFNGTIGDSASSSGSSSPREKHSRSWFK